MLRVFKTRWFTRFARDERISDDSLSEAIARAERGLVDAELGGGVIKQRVARAGQGRRSGGYRLLAAFRTRYRAVFVFGFAKRERENIDRDELITLRELATAWLAADAAQIAEALKEGVLKEVAYDESKET